MDFHFPIRRPDKTPFTDANELYQALEREVGGYYLLGANGFWHGGIHISDRSAPHCVLDDALCCMADGEVVAYRLNEDYRESTFGEGASSKKLKYSNSFCLIRHEYRSPANPEEGANHGKQNTLTFYSLYMHLLPYNHYQSSERLRPSYWQGKARGTAHRRLPLYNAPLNQAEGEPAGPRIGKLELCVSSVVEFDSQEVVTLRIGDQRHRMVQCTLVSGGCWGPESVPPTFWTIVDDSFLRWETVTPTVFNRVVSANTRIKAGDPIGYLGQIENIRSEEGETDSRYQVHLEIFTADADVRDFLQNAAGLKTGKQYLHLPNGTVLRKQAPSAESITLTRPHALELSKTPLVQDGGEDCYAVRVIENDQPVTGLLMKADAHIITQHDWEKLGFQIVEEQNPMADGFLDVEAMPPFFRDLFAKLDTNRDGTLSADELTAGLRNPALRDQWAKLVAHHPTEWQEKAASPKWRRLDELFEGIPKALKHEKQRIDNFVFWDELPATVGLHSGLVYHFHPIAFIEAISTPQEPELIAVAGSQHDGSPGNKMMFIGQAVRELALFMRNKPGLARTLVVFTPLYNEAMLSAARESASLYGANFVEVESAQQLINYLNYGKDRRRYPIEHLSFFSHGVPHRIAFGYQLSDDFRMSLDLLSYKKISPLAFSTIAQVDSYACRTGVGNRSDFPGEDFVQLLPQTNESLAQLLANHLKLKVRAFIRRSEYKYTWGSREERNLAKLCGLASSQAPSSEWCQRWSALRNEREKFEKEIGSAYQIIGALGQVVSGDSPIGLPDGYFDFYPK
ncbi:EF-hand domain-containing protein [Pseudomonas resinovorans]|uniref:EF-hand domain-containing protein n=1 Tax=Metapseudomonas resinovorans TaxID=53412 RepID=A0ABT4Y8A7_METRE|nr:EF-hand domain-containing protein [Pseudomonas resinovorans]MDA8484862.1 EF-hand domain-containing protein [Pseudomonas resinovorans]